MIEDGETFGSDNPDETELRLCIEDKPDAADNPDTVESVILGAGLSPNRNDCKLDISSVKYLICFTYLSTNHNLHRVFKSYDYTN